MTGESTERVEERVQFDAADPYADVDASELPEWWRENRTEFAAHDLLVYLPSRFADGVVVQRKIEHLESALNVDLQLFSVGASDPEIRVDGTSVATVPKRRTAAGFSVYELSSDTFEDIVRDAA